MDFLRVVTVNITYDKDLNKTYVFKGHHDGSKSLSIMYIL